MNLEVDSKDEVMHRPYLNERSVIFKKMFGGRERVTTEKQLLNLAIFATLSLFNLLAVPAPHLFNR